MIGGGLGGLSAAGRLRREGCEVTLFERTSRLGGKAYALSKGALRLDGGPTLVTLPGWIRETFAALGAEALMPSLLEVDAQCAYHFDDGSRFEVWRDAERTSHSARALDAEAPARFRRFYRIAEEIYQAAGEPYLEAPYRGAAAFFGRVLRRGPAALWRGARLQTLSSLAESLFTDPRLRQFVGRFATYAGASPFHVSAAFAQVPHLERAFGTHHPRGGMGALVEALIEAVRRLGVAVHTKVGARWSRRGGCYRLEREEDGTALGEFDAVVVNGDPMATLGRDAEPRSLSGYVALLRVGRRLSLPHHLVRFSADDAGEFERLFAPRDASVPDAPTVYYCHPAATDPSMAGPDESGVMAMINAPALPAGGDLGGARLRDGWDARGETTVRLRARCIALLGELAPEARGRIELLEERTPLTLERLGAPGGSIYGFLPHGRLGPFRRPRIQGPTPGLFFAGGGTHPGGGVPLVLRSGQFAAELALRYLRREHR